MYKFTKEEIDMCKLVAFAEKEIQNSRSVNIDVENYSKDVLKRFQELYPEAIFICGNLEVGSKEWKDALSKYHIYLQIDNTWQFYSANSCMTVTVLTNGEISLDTGTAECIFNYVND